MLYFSNFILLHTYNLCCQRVENKTNRREQENLDFFFFLFWNSCDGPCPNVWIWGLQPCGFEGEFWDFCGHQIVGASQGLSIARHVEIPRENIIKCRECHRFMNLCGLVPWVTVGVGTGCEFATLTQPVPVTWVWQVLWHLLVSVIELHMARQCPWCGFLLPSPSPPIAHLAPNCSQLPTHAPTISRWMWAYLMRGYGRKNTRGDPASGRHSWCVMRMGHDSWPFLAHHSFLTPTNAPSTSCHWNRDSRYQSMVTCIVDMHVTHSRYACHTQ